MNAAQADANTDAKSIDARSRGTEPIRLLAFATPGASGVEETHLRGLLENFHTDIFPFDRRAKVPPFFGNNPVTLFVDHTRRMKPSRLNE